MTAPTHSSTAGRSGRSTPGPHQPTRSLAPESTGSAGRAALTLGARFGLVVRTVFYLLLAYLVVRIALLRQARQADAHGALAVVSSGIAGRAVVIAAATGFVLFGGARIRAAWKDEEAGRSARITTALQGFFSVAAAAIPASYARGHTSAGSEQQSKHTAVELMGFPGGEVLAVLLGIVIVSWCIWQLRTALNEDYLDGLALEGCSRWVKASSR